MHVSANRGREMWVALLVAGQPRLESCPTATEAMNTLRVEKGHVVASERRPTDAQPLPISGWKKLVRREQRVHEQNALLGRAALTAADRWQLAGLSAQEARFHPAAARRSWRIPNAPRLTRCSHVASWCFSPNLNVWIALCAARRRRRSRHGETLWGVSPLADEKTRVRVGASCFVDPDGERLRV